MATIRHLRNAPITEAVVDFRVSLPSDFRSEDLRAAKEKLSETYPHGEERKGFQALFEFTGLQPAAAQTRELGFHGLWLDIGLQIRPDNRPRRLCIYRLGRFLWLT